MSNEAAPEGEKVLAAPRQFSKEDRDALKRYQDKQGQGALRPTIKINTNGKSISIKVDHANEALGYVVLANALGTADQSFVSELLSQLANASGSGPIPSEGVLNFMLSVIEGVAPKDQLEAMIAAQMAAVHCAMMTFARRLNHVDNIPQQDAAERAFNKLARTFAVQMEALKRYRTGGEQKVTVQHVTVNDGGQAIVGAVATQVPGGGGARNPAATA